ncbi:hypothetical protein [Cryptosporangium phraense]|uniref:hypothetical protein n=1 Tax=Cryptosporangium phraense TaxID=2593070 RepID=UPI001478CAF0|nr:hypothetical protein [Cryptosporangium phraense]
MSAIRLLRESAFLLVRVLSGPNIFLLSSRDAGALLPCHSMPTLAVLTWPVVR